MARTSSRTARTYRSRIDVWILLILGASMCAAIAGLVATGLQKGALPAAQAFFILLGASGFVAWLIFGTSYTLESDRLVVRSGPISWKIPLAEITSIEQSRGFARLKSGPALSMDRLTITYRGGKQLNISPADKPGFLKEIAARGARL